MKSEDLRKDYNRWHTDVYQAGNSVKIDPKTRRYFNLILDYLNKNKKIKKGKKILDVACGKGLFLKVAKKRGLEIFGLDISNVAINKAKEIIKGGNFMAGSAEEMPYQDEEFDYITCLGSLEHFSRPEKGAQEISRVLKKDGVALVYVPNLMFLGHIYLAYRDGVMPSEGQQGFSEVFYTYKGWKKLLEDNGLKVIAGKSYNRIYGTKKVSSFVVFLWENFVRFFTPFNLSYIFIFICQKK